VTRLEHYLPYVGCFAMMWPWRWLSHRCIVRRRWVLRIPTARSTSSPNGKRSRKRRLPMLVCPARGSPSRRAVVSMRTPPLEWVEITLRVEAGVPANSCCSPPHRSRPTLIRVATGGGSPALSQPRLNLPFLYQDSPVAGMISMIDFLTASRLARDHLRAMPLHSRTVGPGSRPFDLFYARARALAQVVSPAESVTDQGCRIKQVTLAWGGAPKARCRANWPRSRLPRAGSPSEARKKKSGYASQPCYPKKKTETPSGKVSRWCCSCRLVVALGACRRR